MKKSLGRKSRVGASSASALAASILAMPLMAAPSGAQSGARTDQSVVASQAGQSGNPALKFASIYQKESERFTIVGLDDSHPVYRNAKGQYFYLDPATGDMKFLSSDYYQKFTTTVKAGRGVSVKMLKLQKYAGKVSLSGIDARGNVVQKNSRGEKFYLDPTTGDMVFVK